MAINAGLGQIQGLADLLRNQQNDKRQLIKDIGTDVEDAYKAYDSKIKEQALGEALKGSYNQETGDFNRQSLMQSLIENNPNMAYEIGNKMQDRELAIEKNKLTNSGLSVDNEGKGILNKTNALKQNMQELEVIEGAMRNIYDQSSYSMAMQQAQEMFPNLSPLISSLPKQYDPKTVGMLKSMVTTRKDQTANDLSLLERGDNLEQRDIENNFRDRQQNEVERHNRASESISSFSKNDKSKNPVNPYEGKWEAQGDYLINKDTGETVPAKFQQERIAKWQQSLSNSTPHQPMNYNPADAEKYIERDLAMVTPETKKEIDKKRSSIRSGSETVASINNGIDAIDKLLTKGSEIDNIAGKYVGLIDKETPLIGGLMRGLNSVIHDQKDIDAINQLDTIKSQVVINVMQAMKNASETGATGFGAMNQKEFDAVKAALASLERTNGPKELKENLKTIQDIFKGVKDRASKEIEKENNLVSKYYDSREGKSKPSGQSNNNSVKSNQTSSNTQLTPEQIQRMMEIKNMRR